MLRTSGGEPYVLERVHREAAPGALGLLVALLEGEHGAPRYLSGVATLRAAGVVVEPIAVLTAQTHVLDLAPADLRHPMPPFVEVPPDPIEVALATASSALAEAAHLGLRHLPAGGERRFRAAAEQLHDLGLESTARRVVAAVEAIDRAKRAGDAATERAAVDAWADAAIRIELGRESLGRRALR